MQFFGGRSPFGGMGSMGGMGPMGGSHDDFGGGGFSSMFGGGMPPGMGGFGGGGGPMGGMMHSAPYSSVVFQSLHLTLFFAWLCLRIAFECHFGVIPASCCCQIIEFANIDKCLDKSLESLCYLVPNLGISSD